MMKLLNTVVAVSVVVLIGVVGCKQAKQEAPAPAPQTQQMPAGHPPTGGATEAGGVLSGKVVETMNSGGYTYVALENKGQKTWIALPDSKVKVGQKITCQPGMEMKNFTSKTLNRTFDSIIFSGGIVK
jgi:hypothetical protein